MKKFRSPRNKIILFLFLFVFFITSAFAQSPTGSNLSNPIQIGTLQPGIAFQDSKNNSPSNGYGNDIGYPSDDIYHQFALADSATVTISHCGSDFDTYIRILNSSGTQIASVDDNGSMCTGLNASLKIHLDPGTYYLVSEGYINYSGNILITMSIPAITGGINTDFSQQMKAIFSHLELSRVPYGILRDVALEQTELDGFDGSFLADTNYVDNGSFNAIYQTLKSAKVNGNAFAFPYMEDLETLNDLNRARGKIILSGLFFKHSRFKQNAVENNWVQILNNQVYDVYTGGVWQDPYEIKNTFAASTSTTTYYGKTQQLLMPSALWMTNAAAEISNVQVDAGDGQGFRTFTVGQLMTVNYPDTGIKTLIFKLTLANSTILRTHAQINIKNSVAELYPDLVYIPVTATESYDGKFAKGLMTIKYANPALGMQKPLIVVEGFDTGNLINRDNDNGDNNFGQFMEGVRGTSNLDHLLYGDAKYDVVYIDWEDGTDDIKRNAMLVKEVIRQVNALKAIAGSSTKNAIIGLSMGGLATRWALKTMENVNENHQSNLFVSYDTPHQGANIPVGYQFMANHLSSLYLQSGVGAVLEAINFVSGKSGLAKTLRLASTPAAKQMLINYVNANNVVDNSVHNAWQAELLNLGFPQGVAGTPIRNVAISNGSECAALQVSTPNSLLLSYEGRASTNLLGDLGLFVLSPFTPMATGKIAFLAGMIPGKNEIRFDIKVNTIAEGGNNRVYYNKIIYRKKVLWLIPVNFTITDRTNNMSSSLAYDSYSGGYFDTRWRPKENPAEQNFLGRYNISIFHQRMFTFVPVTSALDIGQGNIPMSAADFTTKYKGAAPPISPKNTPFVNFITARKDNESHLQIGDRTGLWLAGELNNSNPQAPDCTGTCASTVINGPDSFCTTATYTISDMPVGATILWNVTYPAQIISGQGTTSINIQSSAGSASIITAVITNPCGTFSIVKNTRAGLSAANIGIHNYPNKNSVPIRPGAPTDLFFTYNNAFFAQNNIHGITSVKLVPQGNSSASNALHVNPQGTNFWDISAMVTVTLPSSSTSIQANGLAAITYYDNCNNSYGAIMQFRLSTTGARSYVVYPNPSSDEISIDHDFESENMTAEEAWQITKKNNPGIIMLPLDESFKSAKKVSTAENIQIMILDDKKQVLFSKSSKTSLKKTTINVSKIPNGNYFLHVINGNDIDKRQIVIRH